MGFVPFKKRQRRIAVPSQFRNGFGLYCSAYTAGVTPGRSFPYFAFLVPDWVMKASMKTTSSRTIPRTMVLM